MNGYKFVDDMIVYHDDNGKALYGFKYEGALLTKFVNLDEKEPKEIILPDIFNSCSLVKKCEKRKGFFDMRKEDVQLYCDQEEYLDGFIQIDDKCFDDIKKATIIVPSKMPVKFDMDCFKPEQNITIVASKQMGLKRIQSMTIGGEYRWNQYMLLADKRLTVNYKQQYSYFRVEIATVDGKMPDKWKVTLKSTDDILEKTE